MTFKWNATCGNQKYHLLNDWDTFGFCENFINVPHGNWP
jgi:hypothetical protein